MASHNPNNSGSGPESVDIQRALEVFMPAISREPGHDVTRFGVNIDANTLATLLPDYVGNRGVGRADRAFRQRTWELEITGSEICTYHLLSQTPTSEGVKYDLKTTDSKKPPIIYREPTPEEARIALGALALIHAYIG